MLAGLQACAPFMYGYTSSKANGRYSYVSAKENSFGYKRLKYNTGYHNRSELTRFLNEHSYPDFIYEEQALDSNQKVNQVILFYSKIDSAYTFREKKKCWCSPMKIESRKISQEEKSLMQLAMK